MVRVQSTLVVTHGSCVCDCDCVCVHVCVCVCCVAVRRCSWNGTPDKWDGGSPGDGKTYTKTAYVKSVKVTPFNEPNDIMVPAALDQPDGCDVYYTQSASCAVWMSSALIGACR
jgi:hypothetical protein